MIDYGINSDSLIIVKRNGKEQIIRIDQVVKGDYVKGYNSVEKLECINMVIEVEKIQLPPDVDLKIWYKEDGCDQTQLICGKSQRFPIWDYEIENYTYVPAKDLKCGNILRAPNSALVKVDNINIKDCNNDNPNFIILTLSNKANFYVKRIGDEVDPSTNSFILTKGQSS